MDVDEAIGTLCSIRRFQPDPVPEDHLREIVAAALRAPIPSRQEVWTALAVTDRELLVRMREAVEGRLDEMARWSTRTRRGPGAYDYFASVFPEEVVRDRDPYQKMKAYSLFFERAPAVLAVCVEDLQRTRSRMARRKGFATGAPRGQDRIPGVRWAAGQLARALWHRLRRPGARRQGPPPGTHDHLSEARPDLQSVGAALQNLCLAAHARGYGACWMTAPLVARDLLEELLGVQPPWHLTALLPLGIPAEHPQPRPRRDLDQVLSFRRAAEPAPGAAPAGGSG